MLGSFDGVSLDELRKRTSEKWTTYPPDVLPAFVAEMDFALAPPLRRALEEAIVIGDCGYAGLAQLTPAFASFAARRWNWSVAGRSAIGLPDVMAGVSEALHALTARGDAVVINPPVYPPFFEVIRACERSVREVPLILSESLEWALDFDALEAAFRAGARAYLLCSPQNPAGRVWTGAELSRIAELARKYRVLVISDEIHAPLTMPGIPFVPFLQAAGELDALALHSASKAWNIAGLKCALAVAGSAHVHDALLSRMSVSPSDVRWRIGQFGAIASTAA
ncbi:MAG TPA: aminotransferase class I/II-fold pyridoxal phosphate-dependent enzyme, partial [Candidatus Baltobacteraceae bacterium]|nr:aminotransferase class I/II-fold pyridoxal phosphate-dependent enzyme [Candidatus Baltobacteraceae bacterium]